MTKKHQEIDDNPFNPANDPVCRAADLLLIFSFAFAGASAALIALIRYFGAA